jgi:hypothetical protein
MAIGGEKQNKPLLIADYITKAECSYQGDAGALISAGGLHLLRVKGNNSNPETLAQWNSGNYSIVVILSASMSENERAWNDISNHVICIFRAKPGVGNNPITILRDAVWVRNAGLDIFAMRKVVLLTKMEHEHLR